MRSGLEDLFIYIISSGTYHDGSIDHWPPVAIDPALVYVVNGSWCV